MSSWIKLCGGVVGGAALLWSAGVGAATPEAPHTLPNADFESGTAPWLLYAGKPGTLAAGMGSREGVAEIGAAMVQAGKGAGGSAGLVVTTDKKTVRAVLQCTEARDLHGNRLRVQAHVARSGAEGAVVILQYRQGMPLGQEISDTYVERDGATIAVATALVSTAAHEICVGVLAWGTGSVTFDDIKLVRDDPKFAWNQLKKPTQRLMPAVATPEGEVPPAFVLPTLVAVEAGEVKAPLTIALSDKKKKKDLQKKLDAYEAEREVEAFEMGTHEVSRAQWKALMPYEPWNDLSRCDDKGPDDDRRPVTCVSIADAMLFANQLSLQAGLTPVYEVDDDEIEYDEKADGYRLPSPAEWRFAFGGAELPANLVTEEASEVCQHANVRDQSWLKGQGEDAKDDGVFGCDDGHEFSAPVGSFKASERGLYDMMGNVAEWVFTENDDGVVIEHAVVGTSAGSPDSAKGGAVINQHRPSVGLGFRLARGASSKSHDDEDEDKDDDKDDDKRASDDDEE